AHQFGAGAGSRQTTASGMDEKPAASDQSPHHAPPIAFSIPNPRASRIRTGKPFERQSPANTMGTPQISEKIIQSRTMPLLANSDQCGQVIQASNKVPIVGNENRTIQIVFVW